MMLLATVELLARRGESPCFSLLFLVVIIIFTIGRETIVRRGVALRHFQYQQATTGRPEVRIRTGRRIERDLIELSGPECPARIRYFHHLLGEGRRIRRHDYTEFLAEPNWRSGAMRITTTDWRGAMERYYGAKDILIGDASFDPQFVIQSNPEDVAKEFLDGDTRDVIRRLAAQGTGPFMMQLRPRQLLVRVSRRVQEGRDLERFIDDCTALARRLRGAAVTEGVAFGGIAMGGDALCQVCGTKIEPDKRVLCKKCRTPHHMDCWTYNDGCSTFACGERKSIRA